jgi:hypothetical protein
LFTSQEIDWIFFDAVTLVDDDQAFCLFYDPAFGVCYYLTHHLVYGQESDL